MVAALCFCEGLGILGILWPVTSYFSINREPLARLVVNEHPGLTVLDLP